MLAVWLMQGLIIPWLMSRPSLPLHTHEAQPTHAARRLTEILSRVREETAACNATHARGGG